MPVGFDVQPGHPGTLVAPALVPMSRVPILSYEPYEQNCAQKKGHATVVNPLRFWSGWRDSNARPQRPERCTLAKLSHIPNSISYTEQV